MVKLSIVLSIGLIAASPAAATAPEQAPAAPESEAVVCRSEASTGWRTATRRVCKTRAQWAAEAAESGRRIGRFTENPAHRSQNVNGGPEGPFTRPRGGP